METNFTTKSLYSNTTTNSTVVYDYYCTEMPVGPWIWGGLSIPCACVGVPASIWLLWVLIQRQHSSSSNDVYMINLTIMDLIFNLFSIPGVINYFVWKDDLFSKIADILYGFNTCGRPLCMTCICVDCYMAVVCPIKYMKMKRSSYRLVACAMVWGFTVFYGVMGIDRQLATTYFAVIPYLLSLPTITACDLAILHALKKPDPSRRTEVHPQKQRALQTIINSLVMAIVSYLPPVVIYGFQNLITKSTQERMCVITLPILIAPMIGCTLMPFLYLDNLGKLSALQGCRCTSETLSLQAQHP